MAKTSKSSIHLVGDVDDDMLKTLLAADLPPKGQPLTVWLATEGGDCLVADGCHDYLRYLSAQGHHVTVVVAGYCQSAGFDILCAGDTRLATPNSTIMLHKTSFEYSGSDQDVEAWRRHNQKVDAASLARYAARTGHTRAWFTKRFDTDFIVDTQQALRFNLIDGVLGA